MLVATRDPFHSGAPDVPPPGHDDGLGLPPRGLVARVARLMSVMQVAGTLLGIPVGLASAYSIYRANFSAETTCQSLRSGIIAMLDKSVDASTRRMLVRRDVEAFEKSCAAFDPDAHAAFKTLLAAEPQTAPVAAAPVAVPREAPPKEVVRKAEPRPAVTAKKAVPATTVAAPPPLATEQPQRDAAVSDAKWLDAVRQALVKHEGVHDAAPAAEVARLPVEPRPLAKTMVPPPVAAAPTPITPDVAPALPPPQAVATPVQPVPEAAPDHPVPPGSIPYATPGEVANADADQSGQSRFGWLAHVPILNRAFER